MWQRQMHDAWQQGKRTVGNMWNHAVKIAGGIDRAFGIGKRIYGALQPALEDLGVHGVHRGAMQAFSGYEAGRNRVLGGYNNVQATLSRLRRAAPELDLG